MHFTSSLKSSSNMNIKTISVLLLAIAAVQGGSTTIKCHQGLKINDEGEMTETTCSEGVTQCLKASGTVSGQNAALYSCSPDINYVADVGCSEQQVKISGVIVKANQCLCTGNLCNSASTRGISSILAISCFMIALSKFAA